MRWPRARPTGRASPRGRGSPGASRGRRGRCPRSVLASAAPSCPCGLPPPRAVPGQLCSRARLRCRQSAGGFHCRPTQQHQPRDVKQHRLSLPRSRAEFSALVSEAEFEVSAGRAHLRALGRDPLPSSCNCWQNPLPRGCRTEVPLSPPAPSGEPSSASRASRPPLLPAPSPFRPATVCQILPVLCVSDFLFCLQPEKSLCLYRGQISAPHPTPDILPFLKANVPYQG